MTELEELKEKDSNENEKADEEMLKILDRKLRYFQIFKKE